MRGRLPPCAQGLDRRHTLNALPPHSFLHPHVLAISHENLPAQMQRGPHPGPSAAPGVVKRRRIGDSPAVSMGSPLVPQSSVETNGTDRSLDIANIMNKANIATTPTPAAPPMDTDDLTAPGHSPFIEDAVVPAAALWGHAPEEPGAGHPGMPDIVLALPDSRGVQPPGGPLPPQPTALHGPPRPRVPSSS